MPRLLQAVIGRFTKSDFDEQQTHTKGSDLPAEISRQERTGTGERHVEPRDPDPERTEERTGAGRLRQRLKCSRSDRRIPTHSKHMQLLSCEHELRSGTFRLNQDCRWFINPAAAGRRDAVFKFRFCKQLFADN